jgi:hypothetical protein
MMRERRCQTSQVRSVLEKMMLAAARKPIRQFK